MIILLETEQAQDEDIPKAMFQAAVGILVICCMWKQHLFHLIFLPSAPNLHGSSFKMFDIFIGITIMATKRNTCIPIT